jgi:hypothetical protein
MQMSQLIWWLHGEIGGVCVLFHVVKDIYVDVVIMWPTTLCYVACRDV